MAAPSPHRKRRERPPIRRYGRLLFWVPSFSGDRDEWGNLREYLVDLEPFTVWRRVKEVQDGPDGVPIIIDQCMEVVQPYACDCPDATMRELHPCKHVEKIITQFFPEYFIEPLEEPSRQPEEDRAEGELPALAE